MIDALDTDATMNVSSRALGIAAAFTALGLSAGRLQGQGLQQTCSGPGRIYGTAIVERRTAAGQDTSAVADRIRKLESGIEQSALKNSNGLGLVVRTTRRAT